MNKVVVFTAEPFAYEFEWVRLNEKRKKRRTDKENKIMTSTEEQYIIERNK